MLQIAGGVILAIVIIFIVLHLIAKFIGWKEEREEEKEAKRIQKMEYEETREYLEALDRGDENAKKGKDYYFKHKPFKLDLDNSLSKKLPKSEPEDKK